MLNPNIGKLIKNYDNRYRLVIDVAHNARVNLIQRRYNFHTLLLLLMI